MQSPIDRRCRGFAASPFLMLIMLAMIFAAGWFLIALTHREFVARIGVAIFVTCLWGAAMRLLWNSSVASGPSKFDLYQNRPSSAPQFDPLLLRLRDEIAHSVRSQSYFVHILWPRLAAFSRQTGRPIPLPSRVGRLPWRGRTLEEIDQLVGLIDSASEERS